MPSSDSRDDLIRTLLRPEAFPWRPSIVEMIETHISWVFLAGDRVVKIKRPVHFGFIDHSTIEQRRHSCEEEIRLNRRLTEDVYRGTVPISRHGDQLVVGADGDPFDWATLMRRLPAERMLDALLSSGSAPGTLGDLLARRLIPFHSDAAGRCDRETDGSAAAVTAVVTSNLDELRDIAGAPMGAFLFALVEEAMPHLAMNRGSPAKLMIKGWDWLRHLRRSRSQLRARTRLRSRSMFVRPYAWRLSSFRRLT